MKLDKVPNRIRDGSIQLVDIQPAEYEVSEGKNEMKDVSISVVDMKYKNENGTYRAVRLERFPIESGMVPFS